MNRVKKWICEHKDRPTFKHIVIIIVLIFIANGVQIFNNFRDYRGIEQAEAANEAVVTEEAEDEKNTVAEIIDNSKGHVIMLVITGTALATVQYKKKHKIKESR